MCYILRLRNRQCYRYYFLSTVSRISGNSTIFRIIYPSCILSKSKFWAKNEISVKIQIKLKKNGLIFNTKFLNLFNTTFLLKFCFFFGNFFVFKKIPVKNVSKISCLKNRVNSPQFIEFEISDFFAAGQFFDNDVLNDDVNVEPIFSDLTCFHGLPFF